MSADYAQRAHESIAFAALNAGGRTEYIDRMQIRAMLFDAYGTLFDVHRVALLAGPEQSPST